MSSSFSIILDVDHDCMPPFAEIFEEVRALSSALDDGFAASAQDILEHLLGCPASFFFDVDPVSEEERFAADGTMRMTVKVRPGFGLKGFVSALRAFRLNPDLNHFSNSIVGDFATTTIEAAGPGVESGTRLPTPTPCPTTAQP